MTSSTTRKGIISKTHIGPLSLKGLGRTLVVVVVVVVIVVFVA